MSAYDYLAGVYTAAVTPLHADDTIAPEDLCALLSFLAGRGCSGALLMGTTGEGPSFAPWERLEMLRAALEARKTLPGFHLLMGTGLPSLEETIQLTRDAFELGVDGVVVLPPYYYRKVSDDGLFAWFSRVIQKAVPAGCALLAYHIPQISGVGLSIDLLARLKDAFPDRFAGIKDSSGIPEFTVQLGERFGKDLLLFTGSDRLLSLGLRNHGAGCITSMAHLRSLDLRAVWDAAQRGEENSVAQERLLTCKAWMDRHQPASPLIKAALVAWHGLPCWSVRPPFLPLEDAAAVLAELAPELR